MPSEWRMVMGGRKRVGHATLELCALPAITWHEPASLLNIDIGGWMRAGGIGLYGPLAGEGLPYPRSPTSGE